MYSITLIFITLTVLWICINYKNYTYKKELEKLKVLENFVSKIQQDVCSGAFTSRGCVSHYSRLLELDKKVDKMALMIKKTGNVDLNMKIQLMDKKYEWMNTYHQTISDPNSDVNKKLRDLAKNKSRGAYKKNYLNALKNFTKKNKDAFNRALRNGTQLPRAVANIDDKLAKTLNKFSKPGSGSKSMDMVKNQAGNKIRENEDGLIWPIKEIQKLINDGKIALMNADFKNNNNAKKSNSNYHFGKPIEGDDISDNKFSAAYS